MLAEQRDTQDFADNFPKLVKERKTEELLQLLIKATGRLKRLDAVKAQVEQLVADPAYTDEVLDAGLKMISANPPAIDPQDGWIVLVNIATEGKRPEKLAGLLRWSIKRTPNPIVYRELIFTLYDLGKFAEAEATLKELTEKFPDERNARNLILLAQIQAKAGKQDEAIATVRDALKQEPNDPDVVRTLAILLSQAGKNDEAIETVRNVLKLDATNPDLNALLGSMLMQAGKNDEAIALFRSLIDKFPNNEEVVKIARSSLSIIYTNMGDFAKGEAELEALFAKNPDDPGVNNDLGYLYADQGKNLEKAEAMIRKAVDRGARQLRLSRQPGLGPLQAREIPGGPGPPGEGPGRSQGRLDDPRPPGRRLLPAPAPGQGQGSLGAGPEARQPGQAGRQANPRDPQEARVAQAVRPVAQAEDGRQPVT